MEIERPKGRRKGWAERGEEEKVNKEERPDHVFAPGITLGKISFGRPRESIRVQAEREKRYRED